VQNAIEVALGLEEIAALLRFKGEQKFRIKAYEHAAQVVRTLGVELGPLVEQGRLQELQGIGAALSRQLQELWNTGSSEFLTRLRSEQPPGAAELVQVESLTPRRIRALSAALGIRSVDELYAACLAGKVRAVAGFGAKTEARLLAACERWQHREERVLRPILLSQALELATLFERELRRIADEVYLAGALRRGEELVSELEFVIVGDAERALRHLLTLPQVLRIDVEGGLAYLSNGFSLRLHAAANSPGRALFVATGNAAHVDAFDVRARARGLTLEGEFANEGALYRALGLNLVPPELRSGRDELELAAVDDFNDLVTEQDIAGMVHCHTTYSDGRNSIREMAMAAHALGMKYITITDHSPSAHYAGGVTLDRLKQQWDEIAAAQEQVPIRILRGTESDILSDGALDFPDPILERFEVVIASIHARHRLDRVAMTKRLERAMALPIFKIWGHGLGRILNHREPIDCDVPAVLDVLAGAPGAVEVNADPHRLDLPASWLPAARERRIPFVISVDAHSTTGFRVLRYGVIVARRGGLRRHEVLNTLSSDEFAARVRPCGASS
jgi:DNA polymerase (family 10)